MKSCLMLVHIWKCVTLHTFIMYIIILAFKTISNSNHLLCMLYGHLHTHLFTHFQIALAVIRILISPIITVLCCFTWHTPHYIHLSPCSNPYQPYLLCYRCFWALICIAAGSMFCMQMSEVLTRYFSFPKKVRQGRPIPA